MEQQRKDQNEEVNINDAGEARPDNEQATELRQEGGKNKGVSAKPGSHDEGQYQENSDKPTMSPGSSEAEVNPSAKDRTNG